MGLKMLAEMTVPIKNQLVEAVAVDGYVRIKKAAEMLGVSSRTITRWIHKRYFDGVIKNDPGAETGSFYLIPEESVEKFHEKRKTSSV